MSEYVCKTVQVPLADVTRNGALERSIHLPSNLISSIDLPPPTLQKIDHDEFPSRTLLCTYRHLQNTYILRKENRTPRGGKIGPRLLSFSSRPAGPPRNYLFGWIMGAVPVVDRRSSPPSKQCHIHPTPKPSREVTESS